MTAQTRPAIAVIGMACRFPGAADRDALWRNLIRERSSVGPVPPARWGEAGAGLHAGLLEDVEGFDHRFFALSPREARSMDPQQRWLLEAAWHCVEDAGIGFTALRKARTAVFVGAMTADHLQAASAREPDSHSALGAYHGLLANRVSHVLGLCGPSLAVDAAHAASMVAVQHALRCLQAGDADYALVAGVNALLDPWKSRSFARAGMLSPDGLCKVFDADADGYVPAEGLGVLLLQALEPALAADRRIAGVIRAVGITHNAGASAITAPVPAAQQAAIEQAYAEAGIDPDTVTYIEAHGTGTALGDPAEIQALRAVFGQGERPVPCHVGSIKSNLGHLEAASGMAGLIKVLLMMQHRVVPRSLNIRRLNPVLALEGSPLCIATAAADWLPAAPGLPLRAGVSSFGIGGVNTHAVLESAPEPSPAAVAAPGPLCFLLSAATPAALAAVLRRWQRFVASRAFESASLGDICGTLRHGRAHLRHRFGLMVADKADLAWQLLADATERPAVSFEPLTRWLAGGEAEALPTYAYRPLALPSYPFERRVPPAVANGPAVDGDASRRHTTAYLTQLLAERLGCEPAAIAEDDYFVESLGVDSFINMEVLEALQATLGPLPRTLLFEHPTVARLSAHLIENHGEALARLQGRAGADLPSPAEAGTAVAASPQEAPALPVAGGDAEPIAIIGLAGRFPGAPSVDALWALLIEGRSAIRELPPERWDWRRHVDPDGRDPSRGYTRWGGFIDGHDCFDAQFFRITPRQAALMDPQQRVFLETAWATLEDAGYTPAALSRDTGVFVGASTNTYGLWAAQGGEVPAPDTDLSDIANRVSYTLDLHGPSLSVDTACSASLTAVHLAVESLRRGECQTAIAGGVSLTLHPNRIRQFCRKEMLHRGAACHPFGEGDGGFVDGEGACAVLLKPLARALADGDTIHGLIRGTAIRTEGRTSGYTVPSPDSQARLIAAALARAGVDARSISYVEAHGTGTRLGDPIEIDGLTRAFRRHTDARGFCAIGSLKSNIGHLIAAAGIAGLAKVLLQMRHRTLVPSLHAQRLNPYIDFEATPFRVQRSVAPWTTPVIDGTPQPLRAGLSAFGSGGANAHLVLEAWDEARAPVPTGPPYLVPLSARSEERLQVLAGRLAAHLAAHAPAIADVAYTLQTGREPLPVRAALVVDGMPALQTALATLAAGGVTTLGEGPLVALAGDWLAGRPVDWGALYPDGRPRRIPLPTYPFEAQRHWLPQATTAEPAADGSLLYRRVWQAVAATAAQPFRGRCLVFAPAGMTPPSPPAGARLLWAVAGERCAETAHGWMLRPDVEADCLTVLSALRRRGEMPTHILHLWSGDDPAAPTLGMRTVYQLLRAIAAVQPGAPLEVVYTHPDGRAHDAAVGALLRAASRELPQLGWRTLAWGGPMTAGDVLAMALDELRQPSAVGQAVRRRGDSRQIAVMQPLDAAPSAPTVRAGGTYLIAGGLGGLGLLFAEHLAAQAPCRLVLLGRSAPSAAVGQRLDKLRAAGSQVMTRCTDIAERVQVEAAVAETVAAFGDIHGVIHAAGVKLDGLIADTSWAVAEDALRAKLHGSIGLDEATHGQPLDFFVLFSSIAGFVHGDGLAAYALANGFLDAFAAQREAAVAAGRRRGRSLAIAWPLWADGGMSVPAAVRDLMYAESGLSPLPTAQGLAAWSQALASDAACCAVLHGDRARIRRWMDPAAPMDGQGAAADRRVDSDTASSAPSAGGQGMPAEGWLAHLTAQVADITGVPREALEADTPLADYGMDSVQMRLLISRLEPLAGRLPRSLLLEFPTLAALAEYLARQRPEAARSSLPQPPSLPSSGLPPPGIAELYSAAERSSALSGGLSKLDAGHGVSTSPSMAGFQPAAEYNSAIPGAATAMAATPKGATPSPSPSEPIAIVGVSGRYPGAPDLDTLWDNLCAGVDATGEVPPSRWDAAARYDADPARAADGKLYCRWGGFLDDVAGFDPLLFELTPLEAKTMHPEERLLLESVWTTLEDAGYTRAMLRGRPVGVFVGVNGLSYPLLGLERWQRGGNVALDGSYYPLANRISYFFDWTGPSVPVDTGCSAALVALHQACEALRSGGCEAAVVGGVNLYLHPARYWYLCRNRLVATRPGLRLFRAGGDGFIPGEGVGSVLLKPLAKALADGDRIHAVIKGSAVAHKGRSNGFLAPTPKSQAALYRQVLKQAGVDAAAVGYIELQSAGADMADSAEWSALRQVYGTGACALGSVKPNIGHLEAASGMAQLTKVLLQLRHGTLAPNLVADEANPDIDLAGTAFHLPVRPAPWRDGQRRAAITSAAAGGTAVHVLIEAAPEGPATATGDAGPQLVCLSAPTADRLRRHVADVLARLRRDDSLALMDVAYTLRERRTAFDCRLALIARDRDELIAQLTRALDTAATPPPPAMSVAQACADKDLTAAAALWMAGATLDWRRLGCPVGRIVSLPGLPFERRRCWLYDEDKDMSDTPPDSPEAVSAGSMVADYYNRMTDSLKRQTLDVEDEMYILFAPFADKVPGFSWLKAFFEPSQGRQHLDLMLAKQRELKAMLYRDVDFARVRRVFDIGCGLATDLIQLARAHPQLRGEGFTITPRQAEVGAERITRAGLDGRLAVHCADSTKRPFPGRYDLIIGFEVIFHIENKQAVFANIAEHLDDDGYLILADGVTNTVTEINMPHLGQFTATAPQFAQLLAHNGLLIQDCVDTSREISNFLYDAEFEANLALINAKYPDLQAVEHEHRCWDSFGKVLGLGLVRYLLFTIRKAPAGQDEAALAQLNEARIAEAVPYPDELARRPSLLAPPPPTTTPAQQPAPAQVEARLATIAAAVLELDAERIDVTARFTDYGVGSLQGLLLLEAVNRQLGVALKMTTLYDHSSLRDLARHLLATHPDALGTAVAVEPASAAHAQPQPAPTVADDGIAVIGMAGRFPGAADVEAFWRNLCAGVDSVAEVPPERWDSARWYDADPAAPNRSVSRWLGAAPDVDCFDAGFFRISPREALLMDPQQRLFLETCWAALENAGCAGEAIDGSRCGVYAGVMGSDYEKRLADAGMVPEGQTLLGNDDAVLAARIAYVLNLKGPALTIKTACSSSLVSVHLACRELRGGEADLMLAGGVTLYLDHRPFVMMSKAGGMLSPSGRCRPFSDDADGIAVGDGVGVVVLKRLADALRDGDTVYGVIRASGVNQDGRTNGITAPSMASQKALELDVYRRGGIDPATIGYVEAHGTGTRLGDPIEVAALSEAFRAQTDRRGFCRLGSVKGNIGHTTAAAGVAGLIKTLLCLHHGLIPPSLHIRAPNPHLALDEGPFVLADAAHPWPRRPGQPRRAAVSAFAYTGTNCHLVVDEAPPVPLRPLETTGPLAVPVSARNSDRLRALAGRLADHLRAQPDLRLADIAHSLRNGRQAMDARAVIMAADCAELRAGLEALAVGGEHPTLVREPSASADALLRRWLGGEAVSWPALPGARKLPLPTYPFARERHWVGGATPAGRTALYRMRWQPLALPTPAPWPDAVLVFDGDGELSRALRAAGAGRVIQVQTGEAFAAPAPERFIVRPNSDEDYHALFSALAARQALPQRIVCRGRADDDAAALGRLLRIARALLRQPSSAACRFTWLETGDTPSPLCAAVAGFAAALMQEHPGWRWQSLWTDGDPLAALAAEWSVDDGAHEVRHQGGRRLCPRVVELAAAPGGATPLRSGGCYLITGGLGGVGRLLAGHLIARHRARVMLCGRRPLSADGQAVLAALRAAGGEADYIQADVTRGDDARTAVDAAIARFGGLDGIVHAAGVNADGVLAGKRADSIDAVLAPKVSGARNLDAATAHLPLDVFVLLSSVAAVAGNAGQTDYACANGYLDGFAEWRETQRAVGRRQGQCVSIAWPLWADGGMRVDAPGLARLAARLGMQPLPGTEALAAWDRILGASDAGPRRVVFHGDPQRFEAALAGSMAMTASGEPSGRSVTAAPVEPAWQTVAAAAAGSAGRTPVAAPMMPAGQAVVAEPIVPAGRIATPASAESTPAVAAAMGSAVSQADALGLLRQVFADHLMTDAADVDVDTPFEELGFDSILITGINNRLEAVLGALPKTLLFEHRTIAGVAGYLVAEHAAALAEYLARRHPEAQSAPQSLDQPPPGIAELYSAAERSSAMSGGLSELDAGNGDSTSPPLAGLQPAAEYNSAIPGAPIPGLEKPIPGEATPRAAIAETVTPEAKPQAATPPRSPEPIAIIGLSGRYPMADDIEAFWDNLVAGRDCITAVPAGRWDDARYHDPAADDTAQAYLSNQGGFIDGIDRFEPMVFGISPRDAQKMDPQERLFLQTAWSTFEDAAYTAGRLAAERRAHGREVGVFVGVTTNSYALLGPDAWRAGETAIPESMPWSIANRVSYFFDLHGPSLPVDTACSASLTAIHLACESLRRGECAMALAGGVNLYTHPAKFIQLSQLKMLSPSGRCRSFGAGGDGMVPGEGVGAVLLKPLSHAIADGDRIRAVIRGGAINHGGRTNGYTVPNPQAHAQLVAAALQAAGVAAASIGCIEAHGTGTALGDPVEVAGLARVFQGATGACALGSVKSNIGHLEAAAGIAGVTKLVLQLEHHRLVPSLHAETLNPAIDFAATPFRLQRQAAPWPAPADGEPRRAGISSFGAGGANAHLVLEAAPPLPTVPARVGPRVFVLSARSEAQLRALATGLQTTLERLGDTADTWAIAYTLQTGREAMAERLAIVADGVGGLVSSLRAWSAGQADPATFRATAGTAPAGADEALAAGDLHTLARLWTQGAAVDWLRLYPQGAPRPVSLPTYPFAGKRYWIGTERPAPAASAATEDPLLTLLRRLSAGEVDVATVKQALPDA